MRPLSGTSMATPYVAALAAALLEGDASLRSGAALKEAVLAKATKRDVVFKKEGRVDLPMTVLLLR